MPRPGKFARRAADRFAVPYVQGLAEHLSKVQQSILDLHARLDTVEQRQVGQLAQVSDAQAALGDLQERLARLEVVTESLVAGAAADRELAVVDRQMLRDIYDKGDEQRLRLYELRRSEEYELAFTEAEPLVSYVIPTYDRYELLRDRAIPSLLAQDYGNFEVIVSGDGSPPETEAVVREFDDPRLRFCNRSVRGPYPEDPGERWFMSGTPPLNDAVALARGRWIAILGDDDEALPGHTEKLLAAAREQRLEHVYGRLIVRFANGEELELGSFPPAYGHFTLQVSMYHAGLRFFQFEPSDVLYEEPNDWSLARRMVAAGVRFGMIDETLAVKNESKVATRAIWKGEVSNAELPPSAELPALDES